MIMHGWCDILFQVTCQPPGKASYSSHSSLEGRPLRKTFGSPLMTLDCNREAVTHPATSRSQFGENTASLPATASFVLFQRHYYLWVRKRRGLPKMPSSEWYWQQVQWERGPMNHMWGPSTAKYRSEVTELVLVHKLRNFLGEVWMGPL